MKLILQLIFLFSIYFLNAQISFDNQATALGLDITFGNSPYGGGVSFYDYDKDGLDDVTISTGLGTECLFYKNTGTAFVQELLPLSVNNEHTKQLIWVDFDNDNDLDFFAINYNALPKLYRNENNGTFTDVTTACGFPTTIDNNLGGSWGDYNNDGYLDVFFSFWATGGTNYNLLYKNNGDGSFTNVTVSAGLHTINQLTFCVAFFDYDKDGYQDIYLANDKETGNVLYRNNGNGTFQDVSVSSGTNVSIDAMSTTIDDYNNDGWLDIYVSNTITGNVLLKNNGDGTFTNVTNYAGVQFNSIGWGAVFIDGDNDADKDLYVSGMPDGSGSLISAAFYENDSEGVFNIPNNAGFATDTRQSFSNAIGDVDNDGLPEILVLNNVNEDVFLWKNTCQEANNWLKVKLEGTTSNKMGIGSWIEISAGGKVQYNYTLCGEGYISQNSGTEFFGLGNATVLDYVKVTWLSGQIDYFENVSINQTMNIVEGSSPLNMNNYILNSINIYPNPANKSIKIVQNNHQNLKAHIYTVLGKKVKTININKIENFVDISDLNKGIYLIKFNTENGIINKKLLIN